MPDADQYSATEELPRKRYGALFAEVVASPEYNALPARALRLYSALTTYTSPTRRAAWPGQGELAQMTGLCPRSIRRAVCDLKDAGLIAVENRSLKGRPRGNCYLLTTPPSVGRHG